MLHFVHNKSWAISSEPCMDYVDQMGCIFIKFLFAFAQQAETFIPLKNTSGAIWLGHSVLWRGWDLVGSTLKMSDVGFRSQQRCHFFMSVSSCAFADQQWRHHPNIPSRLYSSQPPREYALWERTHAMARCWERQQLFYLKSHYPLN